MIIILYSNNNSTVKCYKITTEGYTGISRRSVGWLVCWNVVSQTPPTVLKLFKWNSLHMIPMTC